MCSTCPPTRPSSERCQQLQIGVLDAEGEAQQGLWSTEEETREGLREQVGVN